MKVYTKTGDDGTTALIGGKRVPKYHLRIDAYGTVDELIAHIGVIRDFKKIDKHTKESLIEIQDRLMTCSAIMATDCDDCDVKIPEMFNTDIVFLEKEMDTMDESLPPLTSFVLPGGHPAVSAAHVARCVCRRAERIALQVQEEFAGARMVIKYLNRLSDYLFVLSRKLSKDFKAKEIPWAPRV